MHKVNDLLLELRGQITIVVDKYGMAKQTDHDPELFEKFKREVAQLATSILHKSAMEGVDEKGALVEGVQRINLEARDELFSGDLLNKYKMTNNKNKP